MTNWTDEAIENAKRKNPDLAIRNPDSKVAEADLPTAKDLCGLVPDFTGSMTTEEYLKGLRGKTVNKYRVAPKEDRIYNGVLYASKKEANFAAELDLRKKAGEFDFWLRQIPFSLPGGTVYRLDFMAFCSDNRDGEHAFTHYDVHFYEVKGYKTRLGELKRKQTEELYNISIEVV